MFVRKAFDLSGDLPPDGHSIQGFAIHPTTGVGYFTAGIFDKATEAFSGSASLWTLDVDTGVVAHMPGALGATGDGFPSLFFHAGDAANIVRALMFDASAPGAQFAQVSLATAPTSNRIVAQSAAPHIFATGRFSAASDGSRVVATTSVPTSLPISVAGFTYQLVNIDGSASTAAFKVDTHLPPILGATSTPDGIRILSQNIAGATPADAAIGALSGDLSKGEGVYEEIAQLPGGRTYWGMAAHTDTLYAIASDNSLWHIGTDPLRIPSGRPLPWDGNVGVSATGDDPADSRLPMIDSPGVLRQTFRVSLGGRDLRVSAWFQPSDAKWYFTFWAGAGDVLVRGVRCCSGSNLLASVDGYGALLCRPVGSFVGDPGADAWVVPTHEVVHVAV